MKYLSYFLIFILLCFSVDALFITNQFTNGLTKENITFTGNGSIQRFIQVPMNANVTSANVLLSNHIRRFSCYQEQANISNPCGGLSTGRYSFSNVATFCTGNCNNAIDGNYSTSVTRATTTSSYLYINYTIPAGALNVSWQLRGDSGGMSFYNGIYIGNKTIPKDCFNTSLSNTLKLAIRNIGTPTFRYRAYCINITSLALIDLGNIAQTFLYEEGVFWDFSRNITEPQVTVGGTSVYHTTGNFKKNIQVNYTTALQNTLNTCSCTNCTQSGYLCSVPIKFYSNTSGLFEYKNINIVANLQINITVRNAKTGALILQPVNITFINVTNSKSYNTSTGKKTITDLNGGQYTVRFESSGYNINFYTANLSYGVTPLLTAYLTPIKYL